MEAATMAPVLKPAPLQAYAAGVMVYREP